MGQTTSGRDYSNCRQKNFHNQRTQYLFTVPARMPCKQKKPIAGASAFVFVLFDVNVSLCQHLEMQRNLVVRCCLHCLLWSRLLLSQKTYLTFGNVPLTLSHLSETSFPVFSEIRHMCVWDGHVFYNSNF